MLQEKAVSCASVQKMAHNVFQMTIWKNNLFRFRNSHTVLLHCLHCTLVIHLQLLLFSLCLLPLPSLPLPSSFLPCSSLRRSALAGVTSMPVKQRTSLSYSTSSPPTWPATTSRKASTHMYVRKWQHWVCGTLCSSSHSSCLPPPSFPLSLSPIPSYLLSNLLPHIGPVLPGPQWRCSDVCLHSWLWRVLRRRRHQQPRAGVPQATQWDILWLWRGTVWLNKAAMELCMANAIYTNFESILFVHSLATRPHLPASLPVPSVHSYWPIHTLRALRRSRQSVPHTWQLLVWLWTGQLL